ncbi:MAG: LCP family protein [Candidatus Microgenomates bacterium]
MKNSKSQVPSSKSGSEDSEPVKQEQDNSNILKEKPQHQKLLIRFGIALIIILILLSPILVIDQIFRKAGIGDYPEMIKGFISSNLNAVKSQNGRVNILILGIGGKGHDGPDLTDTMILASVSLTNHSVTLISIPRDIWIPEIRAKINSAYYWGETQPERGGGLTFSKQVVSEVTGQPVNYALVIDFSGFQDIVNTIGGIDVMVDRSFTDTKYPIAGKENDTCGGDPTLACRYETIHFDQGLTHMDGATALEFVRSREGDNGENTDFARSARQQKVISVVGKKVLSVRVILNPIKDYKILKAVETSVETDLDPTAAGTLAKVIIASRNNLNSYVLSTDLIVSPPISPAYDNQYVLIPKAGNGKWKDIQAWVGSVLN